MSINHKDITDPNIHEPKGVSAAVANRVYLSDGAGSGNWEKVPYNAIDGNIAYGSMVVTGNSVTFPITAAADTTLSTPAQFSLFTGTGAPISGENLFGFTFDVNRLIVPYTGVYHITAYMNIASFPSNTSKIALRYLINGSVYSSRGPIIKSAVAGDQSQMFGQGFVSLTAGDYIQLTIGSDTSGNILVRDMNTLIRMLRRTG